MDESRYTDWLLRCTLMQSPVFSAGVSTSKYSYFWMIDQLVALHNICLLTVHMPPTLQKETVMIPFRIYGCSSRQQQVQDSGALQQICYASDHVSFWH